MWKYEMHYNLLSNFGVKTSIENIRNMWNLNLIFFPDAFIMVFFSLKDRLCRVDQPPEASFFIYDDYVNFIIHTLHLMMNYGIFNQVFYKVA